MNQTQEAPRKRFEPLCGTGTLRAKPTRDVIMRDGQMSLPLIGQCFIRGHHSKLEESMTLEVVRASDRKVVAKIVMGAKHASERKGFVFITDTELAAKGKESYQLVARARTGEAGPYLALRLPEVKIAREDKIAAGLPVKRSYIAA